MQHISNRVLKEAYEKALELDLEEEFIDLLRTEMIRRGISTVSSYNRQLQLSK